MFLNPHPKDQVSVITQMVVMGCRRVYEYAEWCEKSLLKWRIVVIKMRCHHRRKRGTVKRKAASDHRVGTISSCFCSLPQVSCNYFLEGSWQPIICSTGRSNLCILTLDWENGGVQVTAWQSTQYQGRLLCWVCLMRISSWWQILESANYSPHSGRKPTRWRMAVFISTVWSAANGWNTLERQVGEFLMIVWVHGW